MEVNPDAKHPIYDLIDRAQKMWPEKHDRQSKTLEEAVTECASNTKLKRAYSSCRWNYVVENDVQLPDEYDAIANDLEPCWGIDPSILNATQRAEEYGEVFFDAHRHAGERGILWRAEGQIEMMKPVQQWLSDFRATFHAHDGLAKLAWHDFKTQALLAAKNGECECLDLSSLTSLSMIQ